MIPIEKLSPFKRFCMTIGELPSAYVNSLTYVELTVWLCNYLQETVIPAVNNNAEAVKELQDLFTQLQNYVNNYFDNLDVQDEINTKMDEMVEDGTMDALVNTNITGSLSNLETTDKTNLVSAINEVDTRSELNSTYIGTLTTLVNNTSNKIGNLSNLQTTTKTDTVSAINEVDTDLSTLDSNTKKLTDFVRIRQSKAIQTAGNYSITFNYPTGFNKDNCIVIAQLFRASDSDTANATYNEVISNDQVKYKFSSITQLINIYVGIDVPENLSEAETIYAEIWLMKIS